ncbi:hypothetical protein RQM65_07030 [Pricia sp. S334]|uniref:Uncharacterized protein n=1 Tax=Pricia mediterranea TaxID=3076079 RepID=A0ABU3L3T3_9FLAO|nr:hypothetical protein [Pricia sp. S334]MDT7828410.1 hypothetical protein [Pricia sp. S334]
MTPIFIDTSFDELKPYIYGVASVLVLGALLFAFHRPFRWGLFEYIRTHSFFLTVFGVYLSVYVISRLFFFEEAFVHLYTEDGLFEYLTAIFFLIAAIFFVLAYRHHRKQWNGYLKFVFLTLALLCFFTGMEEISWGQRILGIETPERMKELNYQQETTLHNLIDARHYTAIYTPISLFLMVFFAFRNTNYASFFGIPRKYMPSKKFLVIAIFLPLICWYEKEHFEAVLSFLFCVYGYQLYRSSPSARF